MNKRENMLHYLELIRQRTDELKEIINLSTDQELENTEGDYFFEFADNVRANFDFMEMLFTRRSREEISDESKGEMSNEQLEQFFEENWYCLIRS